MKIESLKDLELKSVFLTERKLTIELKNGKKIIYDAFGDCCSASYIESMDNQAALENSTLLSVESVSGDEKTTGEYEVSKWTFYKFKTTKGMCTLSFRNDSNGYYDGYLEFSGEY